MTPDPLQQTMFDGFIIPPFYPEEVQVKLRKGIEQSFSASASRTVDFDSKQEAMKRSMNHANPDWKAAALDAIVEVASKQASFTSDDILAVLDRLDVKTHDTRALGGILTAAARLKWIRKSGNYVPSKRPACHSRPILIWESLIFTQ